MKTRQMIIVGTMAITITFTCALLDRSRTAAAAVPVTSAICTADTSCAESVRGSDALLGAIGVASDEQLYEALYAGQSLAEIAASHGGSIENIVALQTAELIEQLEDRLAAGQITAEQFEAQAAELPAIVASSAFGVKYA